MECHEGATMSEVGKGLALKSFRGLIADGGQDKIPLTSRTGSRGYRIVKFEIILPSPGQVTSEVVAKIWKIKQTVINTLVDFSDQTLLGVAFFTQSSDSWNTYDTVIFDQEIFNQDIYITVDDSQNDSGANYYLELEAFNLNDNENTTATLKDLRNNLG